MDRKYAHRPIHLEGLIFWLPPYRPGKKRFPPDFPFLAVTIFTSDFYAPYIDGLIIYSPYPEPEGDIYKVRLHFHSLAKDQGEILRRIKNITEIILMDGPFVMAVCREITLPTNSSSYIDDEWMPSQE